MGYIDTAQLLTLAQRFNNNYGDYLRELLDPDRQIVTGEE